MLYGSHMGLPSWEYHPPMEILGAGLGFRVFFRFGIPLILGLGKLGPIFMHV